jgi:translation initiation factor 1 (eIF-1/SUI1)
MNKIRIIRFYFKILFAFLVLGIILTGCGRDIQKEDADFKSVEIPKQQGTIENKDDAPESQQKEEDTTVSLPKEENTPVSLPKEDAPESLPKEDILNEEVKEENEINLREDSKQKELTEIEGSSEVDVDLTSLSSTMVYAEVYNMMINPEEYIGKTIKISGQYYASWFEETEQYYHGVIISDATACCSEGLEFIWDDNTHTYPDEYPEDYTEVEIIGVFDSYEELGSTYYYIATDDITVK